MPKKFPDAAKAKPKETFLTQDEYANGYPEGVDSTDVALAAYVDAITSNDEAGIDRGASVNLFPPPAVAIHRTVIAEVAELTPIAKRVEADKAKVAELEEERRHVLRIVPREEEQAVSLRKHVHELDKALAKARAAMNESERAEVYRNLLIGWAPELFGRPSGKFGPGSLPADSKTAQLARGIAGIDLDENPQPLPFGWRGPAINEARRPVRRIVSVSAMANAGGE